MISKYRIVNLYKRLRPRNVSNVLITHDSIYIKKIPALIKALDMKESGEMDSKTRIFITRKLYRLLKNNDWKSINEQVKSVKKTYFGKGG